MGDQPVLQGRYRAANEAGRGGHHVFQRPVLKQSALGTHQLYLIVNPQRQAMVQRDRLPEFLAMRKDHHFGRRLVVPHAGRLLVHHRQIGLQTRHRHVRCYVGNGHPAGGCQNVVIFCQAAKLVAHFRHAHAAGLDAHTNFVFQRGRQNHVVYNRRLAGLGGGTAVAHLVDLNLLLFAVDIYLAFVCHVRHFANQHRIAMHLGARIDNARFRVDAGIIGVEARATSFRGNGQFFALVFDRAHHIPHRPRDGRAKQAALNRRFFENKRVFNVVAAVGQNADDGILQTGHAIWVQHIVHQRAHQRLGRIPQSMGSRIRSKLAVGQFTPNSLLAHTRLVCHARRLVKLKQGSPRRKHRANLRRMNNRVRVRIGRRGGQLLVVQGHAHRGSFFVLVDYFNNAFGQERRPQIVFVGDVIEDIPQLRHAIDANERPPVTAGIAVDMHFAHRRGGPRACCFVDRDIKRNILRGATSPQ